jgi:predicted TPR repeat methyltransferase
LLLALRRQAPQTAELSLLEARLLMAEGQIPPAIRVLDAAIAAAAAASAGSPAGANLAEMYLLRGEIQVGLGEVGAALEDTAAAVMLDASATMPKLRLGVLLIEVGRFDEAIACLREAVASEPDPAALRGLSSAYERSGRKVEAAALLREAVATWPKEKELRGALVGLLMRERNFLSAIEAAEAARDAGAINAEVFAMMGDAFAYLGQHGQAMEAYYDALKFAPDDAFVQRCAGLSAAWVSTRMDRVAPATLRAMFDLAAPDYDAGVMHRVDRTPGLVRRALQCQLAMGLPGPGPVLDLGCGSGLVGLAVAAFAEPITGYDVSPMMLAAARAKRIYAELREGDVAELLERDQRSWPIILAAGSLPYFGALESVFGLVGERLARGGRFIFSLAEDTQPGASTAVGWRLTRAGVHLHRQSYIEQALAGAGLVACSFESEILCHEADVPLPGWIIVATHAHDRRGSDA